MSTNQLSRKNKPAIYPAICLIGGLLAFFAAYAHSQQIHQMSFNGSSWMDQNLNGALASGFTATPPHNEIHVFYIGYNNNLHVMQIYKPKSAPWTYQDMTALTNGGIPEDLNNDIAGFSYQSNQYIYYVAQ